MSNDDPKMRLGPDHELCPSHVDVDGKPFAFCTNRLGHVGPCSYFLSSERADIAIAQLKKEAVALEKLNEAITNDHIAAVELALNSKRAHDGADDELKYTLEGLRASAIARLAAVKARDDFRDTLERIRADVAEASPHEVAALIDSVLLRHPPHGAESPAQTGEHSAKVEVKGDRWPMVTVFAEAMRAKLEQHRAEKGGRYEWSGLSRMSALRNSLSSSATRLASPVGLSSDPRMVLEEAADVANMAMMVADAAGAFEVLVCASDNAELPLPTGVCPEKKHRWRYVGRGKHLDPRTGFNGYDYECEDCKGEANLPYDGDACRPTVTVVEGSGSLGQKVHEQLTAETVAAQPNQPNQPRTSGAWAVARLGLITEFYYLVDEWNTSEGVSWCRRREEYETLEEAIAEARKLAARIGDGAVVQVRHTSTRAVFEISHRWSQRG